MLRPKCQYSEACSSYLQVPILFWFCTSEEQQLLIFPELVGLKAWLCCRCTTRGQGSWTKVFRASVKESSELPACHQHRTEEASHLPKSHKTMELSRNLLHK